MGHIQGWPALGAHLVRLTQTQYRFSLHPRSNHQPIQKMNQSIPCVARPTNPHLSRLFSESRERRRRHGEAAAIAGPALGRLLEVCRHKTGQSYHVRNLLYSLWNGHPVSLLDLLHLDYPIREDLSRVFLGFGFEGRRPEEQTFFYDTIKAAFTNAGLFEWFIAAAEVS